MSLRWLTDEGAEIEPVSKPLKPSRPGRRRWLILLFTLAFGALAFIYFRQMRQVQAQEKLLAEEVAAGFQVWQETVAAGDEELFITLLATWDPAWQRAQKALFQNERLLDRSALGLESSPAGVSTIGQIEIDPDWEGAWVKTGRTYTANGPEGVTVPVQLTQYYRYERSGFRWLATAPDEEFWQGRTTLNGAQVTISVPGRDTTLARRIQRDLEDDLSALCRQLARTGTPCPAGQEIAIYFDTDPHSLLNLPQIDTPLFRGETYLLPTPSLVGVPVDETGYQALYSGYTTRIRQNLQHNLSTPVPFPNQDIAALCFPAGGPTMKLFTTGPVAADWTMHLPDHNFRYLSPAPDGTGVVLQEYGREIQSNRLRLIQWRGGEDALLIDATDNRQLPRPVGWAGPVEDPHLLIHSTVLNRADIFYNWLDLNQCSAAGCALNGLPGYTVWSPAGEHTLVMQRNEIWLGDAEGHLLARLEDGFNPFWWDENTFGYARYRYPDGNRPVVEIVAGSLPFEEGNEPDILFNSADFPGNAAGGQVFIDFIAPIPGRPGDLFISGPALGSGRYMGYRLETGEREPTLALDFPDTLRGHPGLITPTGYPPFGFSPDGRWLLASTFNDPPVDAWSLFLHDLQSGETKEFTAGYPTYPAQYPFYDWSADGNWLLVVDDGFFRLIAPAHDYERLLPHPHDNCFFSAWIAN